MRHLGLTVLFKFFSIDCVNFPLHLSTIMASTFRYKAYMGGASQWYRKPSSVLILFVQRRLY